MHNYADENDSPAHEYVRRIARLFSAMGQPVSRKTTAAPFWNNPERPEGGWAFQVSKTKPTILQVRAFAKDNITRNVKPTAAWKRDRLAVFQKFVRITTGKSLTEVNDRNVDCWLEDTVNGVLGQLESRQVIDLVYLWDALIGDISFIAEKSPALVPEPEPTASSVVLNFTPPTTTALPPALFSLLSQLFQADDEIVKERERKPGPLPYAEAWNRAHQAIVALRESVGL